MNTFIATIKNKTLTWLSPSHGQMFIDFLKRNDGKKVRITLEKNKVSEELRGWYFASIIPTVRSVVPEWKNLTDDEMHNVLKKNFEYFEIFNVINKRVERFARTVMSNESTTERVMAFIDKIREYFRDNYKMELPSPIEFKKRRDSAPLKNE